MKNVNLESLLVKNFKCFQNLQLHFGKLTVMSGYNCAGKSTMIQPILLLSQYLRSIRGNDAGQENFWPLNGNLIRLGTFSDVLSEGIDELEIEFSFGLSNDNSVTFNFISDARNRYLESLNNLSKREKNNLNFITELNYLSAMRGGVDEVYPIPDYNDESIKGVGSDGQYASFVYNEILKDLETFRPDVNYWLDYIVPNSSADVQDLPNVSLLALKFKLSETSDYKKPINVGYGLAYTFPIIISLLAAKKNDLIVIDSPEAHLHPQAQSKMGSMIAQFAAKGVQIILETHSDHILNGIRLAVMEKKLAPDDLRILFFSGTSNDSHGVISTSIDNDGRLSDWPKGFFDQIEIDTAKLIGID